MQYLLAHDLGTSGDKATLFTTEGQLVCSVVEAYPCDYRSGNRVEQNPDDWYAAVCRATKALTAQVDPKEILGVSFSGHMMGSVLLDSHGQLLRPAIIWADQRATEETALLTRRLGDDRFYQITGNRNNPTNSIVKIMWAQTHDGLEGRIDKSLNCKDYLIWRLTGSLGTDYSDASGTGAFDLNTFLWSEEILAAAGVAPSVMPELHPSTDRAGVITAEAAADTGLLTGTPVFCGCGDGTAASVGTGISQVGQGYISMGSSAWIACLEDKPLLDPLQRTFNLAGIEKHRVYPLGSMQAAGLSYNWMKDELCKAEQLSGENIYTAINSQIARVPAGANGVMFLPYLIGERSPWWDAAAKGAFLGLSKDSTHADMLRAVMEGVTFHLTLILNVLRQNRDFDSLRIIGGGAKEPIWRQMMADVMGLKIRKLNLLEEGCSLGAAVVAGIGAGVFADASAIEKFIREDGEAVPDPAMTALYAPMVERFAEAYTRLQGFFG